MHPVLTVAESAAQSAGGVASSFIAVFVALVITAAGWKIVTFARRRRTALGYDDVTAAGDDPATADRDALRKAAGGGSDQYTRQPFNQTGA